MFKTASLQLMRRRWAEFRLGSTLYCPKPIRLKRKRAVTLLRPHSSLASGDLPWICDLHFIPSDVDICARVNNSKVVVGYVWLSEWHTAPAA